jgi:cell division protein FtsB
MDKLKNKYVLIGLVAALFFGVLIFNDSFRATFARRRAIQETQRELEKVEMEIDKMKSQLASLDTTPHVHEDLVRRELGYIKPGEKEIRFIQSAPKAK